MVGNAQRKRKKGAVSAPDQSVEPVETTTNALQKQQSKILCAANVVCWLMTDAGNLRAGSNTIPSQYTLLLVYMDTVFQRHPRVHHHRPALEKNTERKGVVYYANSRVGAVFSINVRGGRFFSFPFSI